MNARFKTLWHKLHSLWFEFYLGIDTRGMVAPLTSEGVHYTPLPYPMIFKMLKCLKMKPTDVFVDIGCGKGRVVCCACRLPIKKVVAIELNTVLLAQTVNNVTKVRSRKCSVEPVAISAEQYDYSGATVVYLYNPFNARLTELAMEKLFVSYSKSPRPIQVVYANPVHEHALHRNNWLEKYHEWTASDFPVFGYPVSFWRTSRVEQTTPGGHAEHIDTSAVS